MKLYNTLSNRLEEFTPIDDKNIRMYVCGPTVYDRPHIGNARSVVVYDVLYRFLSYIYGKDHVTYIRNITDVDDKINARAIELGITIQELTSSTYKDFQSDMLYLNCLNPSHEPRATDHIKGMIKIIELLIKNGSAYVSNNHVYFDVKSCKDYGLLAGRDLEEMIAGVRIDVSENKRHAEDFVLWKPVSMKDDPSIFDSPWGKGAGWHIECSAMSSYFLGNDFDIHGGGADLIFPHHTNEIAQSSCAFPGSKFAHYRVHNGFLTVNGTKMSKSLRNFLTVQNFLDKKISGEVIRYLLMSTHYRKPLDFNDKALYDATESVNYLYRALENNLGAEDNSPEAEFLEYLYDDLNTAGALSYMHELAKIINKSTDHEERSLYAAKLKTCGNMLGILQTEPQKWFVSNIDVDTKYIEKMITKRIEAKATRNWQMADQIREELQKLGIILEDHPDRTSSWRKG